MQGVKIAVYFCQREMINSSSGLDYAKMFLDDAATLGRSELDEYADKLNEVLNLIEDSGL